MPEEAVNEIQKLKEDFQKEFDLFKQSMSKEMEAKEAKIKELSEANDGLRAALVRQATTQPVEQPKAKTPEEIYKETVDMLAEKALKRMKKQLTGDE